MNNPERSADHICYHSVQPYLIHYLIAYFAILANCIFTLLPCANYQFGWCMNPDQFKICIGRVAEASQQIAQMNAHSFYVTVLKF